MVLSADTRSQRGQTQVSHKDFLLALGIVPNMYTDMRHVIVMTKTRANQLKEVT
jgi:hypothetical protein